jgi:hypothetical protein
MRQLVGKQIEFCSIVAVIRPLLLAISPVKSRSR